MFSNSGYRLHKLDTGNLLVKIINDMYAPYLIFSLRINLTSDEQKACIDARKYH
jgi:hypothetical protein